MGFEKVILDILRILQGQQDGFKSDAAEAKAKAKQRAAPAITLERRFAAQSSVRAKTFVSQEEVCYLMASATLPFSVQRLLLPVMGGRGDFYMVDAERESVRYVTTAEVKSLFNCCSFLGIRYLTFFLIF